MNKPEFVKLHPELEDFTNALPDEINITQDIFQPEIICLWLKLGARLPVIMTDTPLDSEAAKLFLRKIFDEIRDTADKLRAKYS